VTRALAWLVVLPWAAWAIARLFGLERGYPLVALMAFAPYAAVAALVAAAVAGGLRRWVPAAVALLAFGVLALGVLARVRADAAPDEGASAGPHLRVLTANAHIGETPAADLVALVRSQRVDVLAVQELTPEFDRALAQAGLGRVLPHRVAMPLPNAHGVGLFARRPLAPLRGPAHLYNPVPAGILNVPGAPPVEVYAVHPAAPFDAEQTAAWKRDLRGLPPASSPGALRILAGDFNATLDHAELRRLLGTGYEDAAEEAGAGLKPTWPFNRRRLPPVTLDHVLADVRCGVAAVETFPLARSDHKAVLAELVLPRRSG
jgi:endonuclease/exonuclease/phosphatase (EEP) superfamily protein YafD